MLSLSDRQSSTVTVSGWFGTRTVERDLPPNMNKMGDLTELAYSCPCIRQQRKTQISDGKFGAPCSLALPPQSGPHLPVTESLRQVRRPSE